MRRITDMAALEALYGTPGEASLRKVATRLTPLYRKWIEASRFCVLATTGPDRVDASPRGDEGPVCRVLDETRLGLPDWRGNNRLDSLRNIVRDGRVSLMFMVPGNANVVRVIGRAVLTDDESLRREFARGQVLPATVIVVSIDQVYSQCARAILRSGLWSGETAPDVPSVGSLLSEMTRGRIDGAAYDKAWPERARKTMW